MKRTLGLLLPALLATLACGGEKAPQDQGIKIGFFGARTGPTATFALSGRNGAAYAACSRSFRSART